MLKAGHSRHHHWTPLQDAFLSYCAKKLTRERTTFWFNTLFGLNRKKNTIRNHARRIGFPLGLSENTGRFKKGHATWNKGLKGYCPSPNTLWKKGHGCWWKAKPIGSERVSEDGVEVKVTMESGPRNKVWQPRARFVWEKVNGPIPKGNVVLHINGDKYDDRIENLILMTRAELAILSSKTNTLKFSELPQEAKLTAIYKAKLMAATKKLKKQKMST